MSGGGVDIGGAMIVVIISINCGTAYDPGVHVCIRRSFDPDPDRGLSSQGPRSCRLYHAVMSPESFS